LLVIMLLEAGRSAASVAQLVLRGMHGVLPLSG